MPYALTQQNLVFVFHMDLAINSDCFAKQHNLLGFVVEM
jgi:hypothetical protein